ncbi:MAG: FkbM family methyltransferase [Chthoniobacter sp.]|uniref:FkbM family methyltransferase n=1 Tax=Chthoniobacter sp. TaxID=2510640 RepID=UPI0032A609E3
MSNATFLNRARTLANKVISHLGFEVVRRPRPRGRDTDLIPLQIGNFRLFLQVNNPVWREHEKNPEYTAQLGRLAACVFAAYPDGYLIDVGANIGDTAAIVRSKVDAPIVCVEGDEAIFPLLQKNISSMREVVAYQYFLGEKTEDLRFMTQKSGWDTTLIPIHGDTEVAGKVIPLLSLDDLVAGLASPKTCKLLKLDIEGFDLRALRGARNLLSKDKPTVFFEFNHDNLTSLGENGREIFPYLASLGYERLCIYDSQGNLMISCRTSDTATLDDLDDYARALDGLFYYDICAFQSFDGELAKRFLASERTYRKSIIQRKRGHGLVQSPCGA